MTKATTPSKFDCQPDLFKPEPPENPKHVKLLFSGRVKELERGVTTLKSYLDVKGKRSKEHDKRPWVIHGESRSGKSHLARRILVDLPHGKRRPQLVIRARGRMDALVVMWNLLERLNGEFCWRTEDETLPDSPVAIPKVQLISKLMREAAIFLRDGAETATITFEESTKKALETGLDAGVPTKLLRFLAKFRTEQSEKRSLQVALRNPTPRDLAELCGIMAETLLDLKLIDHLLILVDDIDLLEAYISVEHNGRLQRSFLSDALIALHETPGVDVLLTSRSWYAVDQREFQELVHIAQQMSNDELISIHDLRYGSLGPPNAPNPFLTQGALKLAAADARGLPGVFLQHLDTAFHTYQEDDEWDARSYDWYLEAFRRRFAMFRDKCPAAAKALEDAVSNGRFEVDVEGGNPFHATVFADEFVFQSYYSETTYLMSSLIYKIVNVAQPAAPAQGDTP